ncbi:hypothetical protein Tsubulata_042793 [Turnera subulata]|uniref:Jacalin-type lectin domain-containing protein n=1 Tax=Turnera subulata TaxID=218843 RepID=A0A9Q0FZJ6_9ROSI|nr:hypothetical protein Tsubulata_042793 [Turnera subulata]
MVCGRFSKKMMIKAGPWGGSQEATAWEVIGIMKISQIYITYCCEKIRSIQFQYIDENGKLMLSPVHGVRQGQNFEVLTFDLQKEYLTQLSGTCRLGLDNSLYCVSSLTFVTNQNTFGPFGYIGCSTFDFRCWSSENHQSVRGFYGTALSRLAYTSAQDKPMNQTLTHWSRGKAPYDKHPAAANLSHLSVLCGDVWDEKGHAKISQILISYDNSVIHSIQFQYIENGKLVLSPVHGTSKGDKFDVVTFDPENEFLTRLSGTYDSSDWSAISSLTFATNRDTYGPFGNDGLDNKFFEFRCGDFEGFGGFHGTADPQGLRSIGMYISPRKAI